MHRKSADKALIIREAVAEDNHTVGCNFIFSNILGVISAPHLDHHHNLAKLAIDRNIAKADDVVGEEGNRVCAERKFGKALIHFNGAQNRYPIPVNAKIMR